MIAVVCDELCGQIVEFYYLSSSAGITGDWMKLHSKELYDRSFPPNVIISRRTNWVGEKNSYKLPDGKSPLGRPRCRCDDEVKMVGRERVNWNFVAQDKDKLRGLVETAVIFRLP
jgi:hypothetical protein